MQSQYCMPFIKVCALRDSAGLSLVSTAQWFTGLATGMRQAIQSGRPVHAQSSYRLHQAIVLGGDNGTSLHVRRLWEPSCRVCFAPTCLRMELLER